MSSNLKSFRVRASKTVLYFGVGALKNIESFLQRFRRVYIVTSRSAARVSGSFQDVVSIVKSLGISYEFFDGVTPNPAASMINFVSEKVWRFGAEAVIAIGGGSVIDSAKAISVVSHCGGFVEDYVRGSRDVCGSIPVIAVNLTHGTGSEVNRYAVVTLENPKTKYGLASDSIYPVISVDDPKYLVTLPMNQTLYTAFDAFYHALEAACGVDSSPYIVAIAEEAVRNIVSWLPKAIENPKNIEARYWLLYASMLAGIAIDNSRAHIIHAIENVLSGINTSLPHGSGLSMLGPSAVKHLYRVAPEPLHRLLRYIDSQLEPLPEHADKAAQAVKKFHKTMGFNENLKMYGFSEADADRVVDTVVNYLSYSLKLSPLEPSRELLKEIYLSALNF
ncbi:iron-containing alcohol dehydrogenase [Ignisphaera sp. 4213-co]|uniref:Iron-containing alcohol dehydrogenase n=1 Tax=Ignisphaera cupida TaxID=3050454 RepID=A0ABD4Z973_9CREN|nr:iron-containing alcohol dehydrogenase [Ignisphaera sp. 4213-co]MDK6029118.1 iron-containing alcohol dehydrogenase [Ignisphaera sp. 4213-co]